MRDSLDKNTNNAKTGLENKLTKIRGSSDFLRFILDRNDSLVISPNRKNGKMLTYSPATVERKYGISPKNQRAILRILKNDYRCLGYKFESYADVGTKLKSNWIWYKELVEKHNLDYNEALERIHYKRAKVSLYGNCKAVCDELLALDNVAYEIHLEDVLDSGGNKSSVLLYLGNFPISKLNYGSQTCNAAEKLFGEKRQNGESVTIERVGNLSDVLSRIVDKILEVKGLVFGDIKGNSVIVYPTITNRMLLERGLSKEYLDDIMLHHIKG